MRIRRAGLGLLSIAAVLAVGLSSCVIPSAGPDATATYRVAAERIDNINQNEYTAVLGNISSPIGSLTCPRTVLANIAGVNCYDEPYLLNLAFQFTLGKPDTVRTWVVEDYRGVLQGGGVTTAGLICEFTDGRQKSTYTVPGLGGFSINGPTGPTSCPIPAKQGVTTFTVRPYDIYDAVTEGIEVVGVVQLTMESDALIALGGPLQLINTISTAAAPVLRQLNTNLNLPEADSLEQFIRSQIGNILNASLGVVADIFGGWGNRDDIISISPQVFFPMTGTLADLMRPVLGDLQLEPFTYDFTWRGIKVVDLALPTKVGILEDQTFDLDHVADSQLIDPLDWLLDRGITHYRTAHRISRA